MSSDRGEDELELTEDPDEACSVNRESFVDMQEWHLHNHVETWSKVYHMFSHLTLFYSKLSFNGTNCMRIFSVRYVGT